MTGRALASRCTSAVEDLAGRVRAALSGSGGASVLADFVDTATDPLPALAAVRIVGADALAPQVLGAPQALGAPLDGHDADVARRALEAFAPTAEEPAVLRWRDWAFARLLAAHTAAPAPAPASAPAPVSVPAPPAGAVLAAHPAAGGWAPWCAVAAQLAPLTLPGLDGPVHAAVRANPLALSRGAARAMLRRDYAQAARLLRWLAVLRRAGHRVPLGVGPMLEHLVLHAGDGARLALDVAVARRLLGTAGEGCG